MSGTTSLCLTQQWHNTTHEPLIGGLLYSMQAGTLNPQNAFRTAALTPGTEYPNPVTLDASGRVPQMFWADGLVRLILTDKNGIAQFDYDNVPVIGSSGGGGSVDTTDVTRLFSTGFMMLRYGTGLITGYVRANGLTIGDSISGATEFHDDTAVALFQYLWNNDPTLLVAGGRTNAAADWAAHKTIETPDWRGRLIAGMDGMGTIRANRLTGLTFGPQSPDVLGGFAGSETALIAASNLPDHTHPVRIPAGQGEHKHQFAKPVGDNLTAPGGLHSVPTGQEDITQTTLPITLPEMLGTAYPNPTIGNVPMPHIPPMKVATVYIRL